MKLYVILLLSMAGGAGALQGAAIVNVTGDTSVRVQTGSLLVFELISSSFSTNAAAFGLSSSPAMVNFDLVSSGLTGAGSFSASLGTVDGTVSVALSSPLNFRDGAFSGSGYQGAVSNLQGLFQLTPLASQGIFVGGKALLTLRNNGPEVLLNLGSYTLRQDLFVSLGGGPLTVGALVDLVKLESFDNSGGPIASTANFGTVSNTPEPESSVLFLAGGGLLCGLSVLLNRVSRHGG